MTVTEFVNQLIEIRKTTPKLGDLLVFQEDDQVGELEVRKIIVEGATTHTVVDLPERILIL